MKSVSIATLAVVFLFPQSIFAISDDFTVQVLVGGDTTPPTIPAPFTATPIATTQINLTWGISTDDFLLSGYHVWRDGVQVATTTNTFYADALLTASTTYTYYVTAYDSFNNESASSTVVSTSTLQIPQEEDDTGSTQGTRIDRFQDEIQSLVIFPEQNSVVIRYETERHIKSVIRWGLGISYEMGSILEHAYTKFHETRISGLMPGVRYQFTIEGEDRLGKYGELHTGEFTTLPAEDVFPPGNVTNLVAIKSDDDILLSWENPNDVDFTKVRIVRGDVFYPSDIADGWVIYEGDGTGKVDQGAAADKGLWKYYTVFTYDDKGNISSGAVVRVYLGSDDTEPPPDADPELNEISLNFTDVFFVQDNETLAIQGDWSVDIDGSKNLSISIPYEKLPEHLKTILVTLEDIGDNNKVFKFLLRVDKDKTSYTGTLAPFGQSGVFPIRVSVFDFRTAQIGYAEGVLNSKILSTYVVEPERSVFQKIIYTLTQSYLLFAVIVLLLLAMIIRRFMQKEW